MRELWSRGDEESLAAFLDAVRVDDLTDALFALGGTPDALREADRALISRWSDKVRARLPRAASSDDERLALEAVLAGEAGFLGDLDDYYNANNVLLHEVLARRRGMPILLSAVWMEVGRGAGLRVSGIGLPGHFIVRIGRPPGTFADPFAGGAALTLADCRRKVEELVGDRIAWRPEFLSPSTVPAILERVLNNLVSCTARAGDEAGRFRAVTFLSALRPDEPENLFTRAELADALGVRDLAVKVWTEILERFPESAQAQAASERMADGSGDGVVH